MHLSLNKKQNTLRCVKNCLLAIAIVGLFAPASFAQDGKELRLGTPTSMLDDIIIAKTKATMTYAFKSNEGVSIPVVARDVYLKDRVLSMTGTAVDSEGSSFILKGTDKDMYGWVVLKATNKAYEYTTNKWGEVVVNEVPVTKIYPICDMEAAKELREPEGYKPRWTKGPEPHIGEYEGQNVNELESQPGCDKVFYLDITDIMNGDEPITTASNNLQSKEEVYKLWQSVAAGFSNFQMNVTTSPSVYAAAGVPNSGIAKFYNQDGRSNSPLNAFGTTSASTNYRNNEQGYGIGRTAFHEIGHTMGMDHDRGDNGSTEYFPGIADHQWCPIMGNYWYGSGWDEALYTWSMSEYTGGSTFEDDLDRVNRYVEYMEDDIPDSTPFIVNDGIISAEDNRGQIARNTDSDSWTFTIGAGGGSISLHADRTEYIGGAMLDIALSLQDSSGNEIQFNNPEKARYADISADLEAGDYTVVIMGGADGTPEHGFSNYSSLGYYAMEGEIVGGDDTGDDDDDDDDTDTDTGTGDDDDDDDDDTDTGTGDDDDDDDDDDTGDDDDDNDTGDDDDDDDDDNNDDDDDNDDNDDNDDDNDDNDDDDDDDNGGSGSSNSGCSFTQSEATTSLIQLVSSLI